MDQHIVPLRRHVTDLLRAEATPPVYGYLPDDVAHLPVLVVGRPAIGESDQPAVMRMRLDVTLLGRRVGDEDAQTELDNYADECFDVFGGTRGVKVDDQLVSCREVRPGVVTVAGQEIPAYLFTVTVDILTC